MKKQRFRNFSRNLLSACLFLLLPARLLSASGEEAFIHQALSEAAKRGGGVAHLPAGSYHLTQPVIIPDGVELRGESEASVALVAPQDTTFPAIILRNVSHAGVSHLRLLEQGHRYRARAPAIAIEAESRFISIREVSTQGFSRGFSVGREEAGTVSHLVLEACRAEASSYYGFDFTNVDGVYLENCYAFNHKLDGIKLRKQARDVTITGGESSRNGWLLAGNAIDGYAGADTASIYDMVAEENNGSGFYFKTGPHTLRQFGHVRNLFFCGVRARRNQGNGIDINRSGGDTIKSGQTQLPPLLSHVVMIGGISEKNLSSGYYVRGRKVALFAPLSLDNARHGIDLASAWDVTVVAPTVVLALPAEKDEFRYGIQVGVDPVKGSARRVALLGGHVSSPSPTVDGPAAASCLAAWHIGQESRHVLIDRFTAQLPGSAADLPAPEAAATTRIFPGFPTTFP